MQQKKILKNIEPTPDLLVFTQFRDLLSPTCLLGSVSNTSEKRPRGSGFNPHWRQFIFWGIVLPLLATLPTLYNLRKMRFSDLRAATLCTNWTVCVGSQSSFSRHMFLRDYLTDLYTRKSTQNSAKNCPQSGLSPGLLDHHSNTLLTVLAWCLLGRRFVKWAFFHAPLHILNFGHF